MRLNRVTWITLSFPPNRRQGHNRRSTYRLDDTRSLFSGYQQPFRRLCLDDFIPSSSGPSDIRVLRIEKEQNFVAEFNMKMLFALESYGQTLRPQYPIDST